MSRLFFLLFLFSSIAGAAEKATPAKKESKISLQERLSYGAKVASGYMDGTSFGRTHYIEADLYLDYILIPEISTARLSLLSRVSDAKDYLGVQFALPFFLNIPEVGLRSYLAPGYRLISRGHHAPQIEGAISLAAFQNLGMGVGYRLIFNEWTDNGLKDESQFFIHINL